MKKPIKSRGYVLLEALVALLIFSLGLLGMISFQAVSFKIMADSRFRTEAAMLADELLARMSASEISRVQADYGPQGAKLLSWVDNRVVGGSRLPEAKVVPSFSASATPSTLLVNLRIEWTPPGAAGASPAVAATGVYETKALLF